MSQINGIDTGSNPEVTREVLDAYGIQSLIEVIYMQQANKTLDDSMSNLNAALSTITDALNLLNTIQSLHNQIMVSSKGKFSDEDGDEFDVFDDNHDEEDYQEAASFFFGGGINPEVASFLEDNFPNISQTLNQLENKLDDIIDRLEDITPDKDDPTTLYAKLKVLQDDLPTNNNKLEKWILDNYDKATDSDSSKAGLYQQHIQDAITAAQSLNNTQTEAVRRTLFIVEEYYKSAGNIMNAINTLLLDVARNINK